MPETFPWDLYIHHILLLCWRVPPFVALSFFPKSPSRMSILESFEMKHLVDLMSGMSELPNGESSPAETSPPLPISMYLGLMPNSPNELYSF